MGQDPDELSVEQLQELLYRKKRAQRQSRLQRLKKSGRVVELPGIEPPEHGADERPIFPPSRAGALRQHALAASQNNGPERVKPDVEHSTGLRWRWIWNKLLLFVEIAAVVGLIGMAGQVWLQSRQLNRELAEVQQVEVLAAAGPTPTNSPLINLVVLPSGHKPPIEGRLPEPGEAGYLPSHLQTMIESYVPPPIPTPGPQQARRIQIPAINIDKPIVQGDDWEQLKKGVGQHIRSAMPGTDGNMVLSAHNDIYGEIFRHLDKLKPGDEILVSTERETFRYVIRELKVVEPTDVWVMDKTDYASATLISCYPYLVNNKRIVVFADLAQP